MLGKLALLPVAALWLAAAALPVSAHSGVDETRRTAVVSAFPPEMAVLRADLEDGTSQFANGVEFVTGLLAGRNVVLFLSSISTVNAAMTAQLALDRFHIDRIVFSSIAGGTDPTSGSAMSLSPTAGAGIWSRCSHGRSGTAGRSLPSSNNSMRISA